MQGPVDIAHQPAVPPGSCAWGEPSWPGGAPFALFLSHDIDQIHDREMWRILADLAHVWRVLAKGEPGVLPLAVRRICRALVRPKPALRDYETILEIEERFGFRSTFFVLHDRYWARYGARYRLSSPVLRGIAHAILGAGCEIGVHGGYYRFNDTHAYAESRATVGAALGCNPVGIRNHLLRFSGRNTWEAHREAGFAYDATFGSSSNLGPQQGRDRPFWAIPPSPERESGLVCLPLTVMDTTLFHYLRLAGAQALEAAWSVILPVVAGHGLVTLLWHGNYFNEPEYRDWQWVYERLLERLAALGPWCGTGAEIASWWRSSRVEEPSQQRGGVI